MPISVLQASREVFLAIDANFVLGSLESKLRITFIFSPKTLSVSLMMFLSEVKMYIKKMKLQKF